MRPGFALETAMSSLTVLAYLDPGAGSLLLQALLAGGAGIVVFFKHLWHSYRSARQ
jgi:hypothetical protein